jgi:hypothetical protein
MANPKQTPPVKASLYDQILSDITAVVFAHPRDLSRFYVEKYGISRVTATKHLRRLESEGWIARSGPSTHPVFSAGYKRRVSHLYDRAGLEEDAAWRKDFEPFFLLQPNVKAIAQHGFTEMVNNTIDHSEGNRVFIWMSQLGRSLSIMVSDDGIGIFKKISDALQLPDMRQALFELSKGKFTTDPSKHSGEGVFFTSRVFERFQIEANGLQFEHNSGDMDALVEKKHMAFGKGTFVWMSIPTDSTRTLNDVYSEYTKAPDDFDFSKTIVPMKLAQFGGELVSRSQAKRLIARFDRFKVVVLNFEGVPEIGQAFADELFRVYANANPGVEIVPQNMSEQVERMWRRALHATPGQA